MKMQFTDYAISMVQISMYEALNDFCQQGSVSREIGRFASVTIAMLDVGLETAKTPLRSAEYGFVAVINLIAIVIKPFLNAIAILLELDKEKNNQHNGKFLGAFPCTSFKEVLFNAEMSMKSFTGTPVAIFMTIFKLPYQIAVSFWDPENAKSIEYSGWSSEMWSREHILNPREVKFEEGHTRAKPLFEVYITSKVWI